jgi:transcription initiation factor TFIIB
MGGVPRTLEELQQATGVRKKEIGKSYGILLRALGLRVPPARPADYVSRFCSELGLGADVQRQAHRILREIDDGDGSLSLSPVGTSAAAIYLASLACDQRRPQKLVAKVAGVSEVTLRNRFRYVHDASLRIPEPPRGRSPKRVAK